MAEAEPTDDLEKRAKALKIRLPRSCIHGYFEDQLIEDDKNKSIARQVRYSLIMIDFSCKVKTEHH